MLLLLALLGASRQVALGEELGTGFEGALEGVELGEALREGWVARGHLEQVAGDVLVDFDQLGSRLCLVVGLRLHSFLVLLSTCTLLIPLIPRRVQTKHISLDPLHRILNLLLRLVRVHHPRRPTLQSRHLFTQLSNPSLDVFAITKRDLAQVDHGLGAVVELVE